MTTKNVKSTKPIEKQPTKVLQQKEVNKPEPLNINGQMVYSGDELYQYDKVYFYGCSRLRTVIDKKRLEPTDYLFAYEKDNKWIVSQPDYRKSKLFLSEEWVTKNVPKMMDAQDNKELYKYEEAPPILELNDDEKFKNKDGKPLNIEVRGERNHKGAFFKVKDVSEAFEMPNLQNVIGQNDTYIKDVDYKVFICLTNNNNITLSNKTMTFLTYEGMIKLLYVSRNENAKYFRNWATEKLFTIQMGTQDAKQKLASSLIGVDVESIKQVFSCNSNKTPVIYLFLIGPAKDMLKDNKYGKNDLLCKFGRSDDFIRRTCEHDKTYSKEFNTNIELLCYSIIDPKFISQAEANISHYFESDKVDYNNEKELVVINSKNLKLIKEQYMMIQNLYIGHYTDLYNRITELEKELKDEKHKYILLTEQHKNDLLVEQHKNALLTEQFKSKDKDIEILQLKLELASKKKMK